MLSYEEFFRKGILNLRDYNSKGIHSEYSGFNDAFKKYYKGVDLVLITKQLAEAGKIVLKPVKGGLMLYLPEEISQPKLSHEEFVKRAILKLKKPNELGINTIHSGFNDAFRKYFGGDDPSETISNLAKEGKLVIKPAKEGYFIYLPYTNHLERDLSIPSNILYEIKPVTAPDGSNIFGVFNKVTGEYMTYGRTEAQAWKNLEKVRKNIISSRLFNIELRRRNLIDNDKKFLCKKKLLNKEQTWQQLVRLNVVSGPIPSVSWNLNSINLNNINLGYTNFSSANLSCANLINVNLNNAILSNVNFSHANLEDAELNNANLINTIFFKANLRGASFKKANLCNASFVEADLNYADLSEADLTEVDFSYANLCEAILDGAILMGADLSCVDMSNVDLTNVEIDDAFMTSVNGIKSDEEITYWQQYFIDDEIESN